jgi:hypothetical protein
MPLVPSLYFQIAWEEDRETSRGAKGRNSTYWCDRIFYFMNKHFVHSPFAEHLTHLPFLFHKQYHVNVLIHGL